MKTNGMHSINRRSFIRRAAAVGLTVVTPSWQQAFSASVASADIRGHVVSGDKPLRGVRVSDGYQVVTTDASGEFRLRVGSKSGPFVFITTPRGYWGDQFYIPTALAGSKPPVFRLKKTKIGNDYQALYIPDIHLGAGNAEESFTRFNATIDEINRMDPLPALCWMGGDISLQSKGIGKRYIDTISRLKVPVRNGIGNHEMLTHDPDPRSEFKQLCGPSYYSFDLGDVHYVMLDGCYVHRPHNIYEAVWGLLSKRELHWLEQDLKSVPAGMRTVVSIHIPLVSDAPQRRGLTNEQAPNMVVRNADEVIDLLAQHSTSFVLQGHLHENQRITRKGIEFVESVSVCGSWWDAKKGERENAVSGEPRGYRILDVRGNRISHRYQSSAESRVDAPGEIVGLPDHLPVGENEHLNVNVFDGNENTRVMARVDDGPFQPLPTAASVMSQGTYTKDLFMTHHWAWKLAANSLTPGNHTLKVRIEEVGRPVESFEHKVKA